MKYFFKKAWLMRWVLNFWPPFLLTGIHIKSISKNYSTACVELKMRPWNKNAFGCHFGGSLFAMTDPFYVLMLVAKLGNEYFVWDKSADIDFIKPGKGKVTAHFHIDQTMIDDIKRQTSNGEKYLPRLTIDVKDQQGDIVVKLNRTLYIRRKKRAR